MKERFMNDINNNPTAYISDSDAYLDLEDIYNRFTSLYLGEVEGQDGQLSDDFADLTVKKDFEKKIIEKFYDHQVNDKQEISKYVLANMNLNRSKFLMRKNNIGTVSQDNITINTNTNDSEILVTSKKPKIMRVDNEEILERAEGYSDEQSKENECKIPTTYKECRDQLDEEENIKYNDYVRP